jgi:hypothetical protein
MGANSKPHPATQDLADIDVSYILLQWVTALIAEADTHIAGA